jgi:hypothetical protein
MLLVRLNFFAVDQQNVGTESPSEGLLETDLHVSISYTMLLMSIKPSLPAVSESCSDTEICKSHTSIALLTLVDHYVPGPKS